MNPPPTVALHLEPDSIPGPTPLGLARETLVALAGERARRGLEGSVGAAVFACALSRIDPTIDVAPWLTRAIQDANTMRPGPSLHSGVAGLGFVLATYTDAEDILVTIDRMLLGRVSGLPPASMQSGVAGLALYASLRSRAGSGLELGRAVVEALAQAAKPSRGGLIWHTPSSYAKARGASVPAEPVTEFGMVHGMGGTLVALAALARGGHGQAADLARAGLKALWARERPGPNRFGRMEFGPEGSEGTLELGEPWCVGDTGVFRACWLAANATGDATSAERALERLREQARRHADGATAGRPGRIDLCCGSSVIAQVYWRMYRETGETVFQAANERLLDECALQVRHLTVSSFRFGRAGVLLALLSPRMSEEPIWDSILGVSLPAVR